jgi:nitric oxide reductase subunit C
VTKADTRRFFVLGTLLCTVAFIVLTVDTHRTVVAREHSRALDDDVRRGLLVWGAYNCENCHTLLGEGSYYAPDLTQIVAQRGVPYLQAFLADPSAFYSEEEHGRLMPTLGLSAQEIDDAIAFLGWVGGIDTLGWPPRPIRVSGMPTRLPGMETASAASDPVTQGRQAFDAAGCGACHSLEPGVMLVGPSLAGIARRAEERLQDAAYTGAAQDAEGYLRESIFEPSAFLAPPAAKHGTADGLSYMPGVYSNTLDPQAADELVAYLLTLQ